MRTWCAFLLVLHSANAQFDFFSERQNRPTSQIQAIGDSFGVREAFGAWGRVLRNMATRPQLSHRVSPSPSDFTISPTVKKEDLEKVLNDKKEGDHIINERLLYLLLPRIKGQPPFTTTTAQTTKSKKTKFSTTAEPNSNFSSAVPTATTTAANITAIVALNTTTTTLPPTVTTGQVTTIATVSSRHRTESAEKAKWSEEDTKEFELNSHELSILEREYTKKLMQLKAQKKFRESKHASGKELLQEDVLNSVTAGDLIENSTTAISITTLPTTTTNTYTKSQQFTVVFHTASKKKYDEEAGSVKRKEDSIRNGDKSKDYMKKKEQKAKIESKVLSIFSNAVREYDKRYDNSRTSGGHLWATTANRHKSDMEGDGNADDFAEVYPSSVEQVAEAALRNALSGSGEKNAVPLTAVYQSYTQEPLENEATQSQTPKAEPETVKKNHSLGTVNPINTSQETVTKKSRISPPLHSNEESEVKEVLSLIEADEQAEKAEAGANSVEIKRLRESTRAKIMAFLQKRVEKMTAELERSLTTTTAAAITESASTSATTSATTPATVTTTTTTDTTTTTAPATTESANDTLNMVTSTDSMKSESNSAASEESAEDEEKSAASQDIPEAEEEDETDSTADPEVATTTTSKVLIDKQKSASPSYNLNNTSESHKLASVITPIAGIIDNIGPIIAPLLQSRTEAAAPLKAAGVRTYETSGRDLLAHSASENSIFGYGTQLAREILQPGSLQRDREDQQRAMAAKIAQVKENLKYSNNGGSDVNTIPLYRALMPTTTTEEASPSFVQAYQQGNAELQSRQAALNTGPSRGGLPPYFVAPPPGYVGPLPPPPPPPPAVLQRSQYSLVDSSIRRSPVPELKALSPTTPQYSAPEASDSLTFKEAKPHPPASQEAPDSTGFEKGRSEVRSAFYGDTGVMLDETQKSPPSPAGTKILVPNRLSKGSARSEGFGGGRRPTESFEEAASSVNEGSSYFSSKRRKAKH